MKKDKVSLEKTNHELKKTLIFVVIFLLIICVIMIWSNEVGKNNAFQIGYLKATQNITFKEQVIYGFLNNNSVVIANEINLRYLNEYGAIPIYYSDVFGQQVLRCEVKE